MLRSRVLAAKVIERLDLLNHPEFNPSLREPEESLFDFLKYLNPRNWIPASWKKATERSHGPRDGASAVPPPSASRKQEEQQQQRLMSTATNILLGKLNVEAG